MTLVSSLLAVALLALLAQPPVPVGRVVSLTLPHGLRQGETAWIEVELGGLRRGEEIVITTLDGQFLGHLSNSGTLRGGTGSVYPVPLPVAAISNRRVKLRLSLHHGDSRRVPTKSELKGVRLRIMPAAPQAR